MNIEQLKLLSNLEINRLCAVNIMGWEVITEHEDLGNRRQRSDYEVGGIIALYGKRWMARRQGKSSYWNPSEDMNDALLVVAKLNELGWMLYKFANTLSGQSVPDGFLTVFLHIQNGNGLECTEDTPTRSIINAALLAVMDS